MSRCGFVLLFNTDERQDAPADLPGGAVIDLHAGLGNALYQSDHVSTDLGTELNSVPGSRKGYAGLFKPRYALIIGNQQQVGAATGKQTVGDHACNLVELLLQF